MTRLLPLPVVARRPSFLSRFAGFGKRSVLARRQRQPPSHVGIESLETRLALATFSSDANGLITIALGAGEFLTGVSASVSSVRTRATICRSKLTFMQQFPVTEPGRIVFGPA